jgi:hypothetical protein
MEGRQLVRGHDDPALRPLLDPFGDGLVHLLQKLVEVRLGRHQALVLGAALEAAGELLVPLLLLVLGLLPARRAVMISAPGVPGHCGGSTRVPVLVHPWAARFSAWYSSVRPSLAQLLCHLLIFVISLYPSYVREIPATGRSRGPSTVPASRDENHPVPAREIPEHHRCLPPGHARSTID